MPLMEIASVPSFELWGLDNPQSEKQAKNIASGRLSVGYNFILLRACAYQGSLDDLLWFIVVNNFDMRLQNDKGRVWGEIDNVTLVYEVERGDVCHHHSHINFQT